MYSKGSKVQVLDGGIYRNATVVEIQSDKYLVQFDNFSAKYNTHFEEGFLRNRIEQRQISRNALKVKSVNLETLVINDEVLFQSNGQIVSGFILLNDPFECKVTINDNEQKVIDLKYEDIMSTSKDIDFKAKKDNKEIQSCKKMSSSKSLESITRRKKTNLDRSYLIPESASSDNIEILAEAEAGKACYQETPVAREDSSKEPQPQTSRKASSESTSTKKRTDLSESEKDIFEQMKRQFNIKLAEFNVLHDAALNNLTSSINDSLMQASQQIAFSIDRGFQTLANALIAKQKTVESYQHNLQQDAFLNLIHQSTTCTNDNPTLEEFFVIPPTHVQLQTQSNVSTVVSKGTEQLDLSSLSKSTKELTTIQQLTPVSTPIASTQSKNRSSNFGLTPEIISEIFDEAVSAPHFASLLVAKAYEDRKEDLKGYLMYECTKANVKKKGLAKEFVSFVKTTTFNFYKVDEKSTWKQKCVPACNKKIRTMAGDDDIN